ncbi:MAG: HlyD family efflux transporter periplasmic adaptor subunit [Chloroflexi bacterium]|nr:HlyD family efflux transporter periplasmic adaptor subunit [Chloroflexota bacterium]
MRRLLSTLLSLIFVALIAATAALFLIPEQVQHTWQQLALPPEPLDRALTLVGQSPTGAATELRLYGVLEADTSHAMSVVAGRAQKVLVDEGDDVVAGQTVLELDPSTVQADIAAAAQTLAAAGAARDAVAAPPPATTLALADSAVEAAETRLQNARRNLDQAQSLLENPLAIQSQIDQTVTLIPAAEARISQAKAQLAQTDILLAKARNDLSREGQFSQQKLEQQKLAAQTEIKAAEARLQGLQSTLALLQQTKKEPLALQVAVHQAEREVVLAAASLEVARAQSDVAAAAPTEAAIAVADAQVQQAAAALALSRWQAEQLTITAPRSGRVLARLIEAGETVAPGKPLFTIADLSKMEVRIYVSELDLHRIQVGDNLPVEITAQAGQRQQGVVTFIAASAQFRPSNVLNPDDRGDMVFLVKLRLPNPDGVLKPGMPADVLLPLD